VVLVDTNINGGETMLEVKIPSEIQDYKSKVIFGLSLRQLIAVAGAMITAIPVGVIGHGRISSDILPWIIIIMTAPWVGYGFFKFQGLKFEEYARSWLQFTFLPQKRVYEDTDSTLQDLHVELLEELIIQQRIDAGEYEETETEDIQV